MEIREKNHVRGRRSGAGWPCFWHSAPRQSGGQTLYGRGKTKRIRGLPGSQRRGQGASFRDHHGALRGGRSPNRKTCDKDRKSTRLNSSHTVISYAVFCLKKKKNKTKIQNRNKHK